MERMDARMLFPILLLCTVACSADQEAGGVVTRRIAPDGVLEVVSRAPEPKPAPWILEPDLVIGVEYGEDAYMLRGPASFAVLEDGTHVIFDTSPAQIRLYDAQGVFLREFGRPGSGPTDLPSRATITCLEEKRFDVWGGFRPFRVQRWNPEGDLLRVNTLPQQHPLFGKEIAAWDGTYLFGYQIGTRRADFGSPLYLVRTDLSGAEIDTIHVLENGQVPLACFLIEAESDYGLTSRPLLTGDGRLCVNGMYEDWVHVVDTATGRESRRFRWEHIPDAIPDTLIEHYRGQMAGGQDMKAGARWLREHLSILGLAEGPFGEIWVLRRYPENGLWPMDVFDREGIYRGRIGVPCPPRTLRPFGDHIYGIGLNGQAPALIRYRLSRPVR